MVELSDSVITRRVRLAEKVTGMVEADHRVRKCRRIDFSNEGGLLLVIELIPNSGAISRKAIARELEFAISQAEPALPWVRVQVG
jgi:hypothetical protein